MTSHKPFKPGDLLLGNFSGMIALFLGYNDSQGTYEVYIPEWGESLSYDTEYESFYVSRPPTYSLLIHHSSLRPTLSGSS